MSTTCTSLLVRPARFHGDGACPVCHFGDVWCVAAGLVKRFVIFLPDPLLTFERFDAFASCASLPNDSSTDARARNLRILVNDLPVHHKYGRAALRLCACFPSVTEPARTLCPAGRCS